MANYYFNSTSGYGRHKCLNCQAEWINDKLNCPLCYMPVPAKEMSRKQARKYVNSYRKLQRNYANKNIAKTVAYQDRIHHLSSDYTKLLSAPKPKISFIIQEYKPGMFSIGVE